MLKIFFITFFIAELIIAGAVIVKICDFDKRVKALDNLITVNKYKVFLAIKDFKWSLVEVMGNLKRAKNLIKQKKEEYFLRMLKTALVYLSILMLKGKYKKGVLAYQVLSEIYSGIQEA